MYRCIDVYIYINMVTSLYDIHMIIYIYLLLYEVSTGRIISRLERAGPLGLRSRAGSVYSHHKVMTLKLENKPSYTFMYM